MVLLFRREVSSFLLTSPAGASQDSTVVLAAIERISSSGMQESVQLCENTTGDVRWVTRTEGKREFFPRVGRVKANKRVRDDDEAENEVVEEAEQEGEEEEEMMSVDKPERFVTPKNRPTQHKRSKHARTTPSSTSTSTRSNGSSGTPRRAPGGAPNAPKLRTRVRPTLPALAEGEEFVPLNLSRGEKDAESSMRKNVVEALARGGAGEGRGGHESDLDDLASLCGRVDGLDVKSSTADNGE